MLEVSFEFAHFLFFLGQRPLELVDLADVFGFGGPLLEVGREFVGVLQEEFYLRLVAFLYFWIGR